MRTSHEAFLPSALLRVKVVQPYSSNDTAKV